MQASSPPQQPVLGACQIGFRESGFSNHPLSAVQRKQTGLQLDPPIVP